MPSVFSNVQYSLCIHYYTKYRPTKYTKLSTMSVFSNVPYSHVFKVVQSCSCVQ